MNKHERGKFKRKNENMMGIDFEIGQFYKRRGKTKRTKHIFFDERK